MDDNVNNKSKHQKSAMKDKTEEGRKLNNAKSKKCTRIEFEKHVHNLSVILQCSNATPLQKHGDVGYICSFCPEQFPKAEDLKTHTLKTHSAQTNLKACKRNGMSRYSVRLDITGLNCKLCDSSIDSLDNLITHFQEIHTKLIHMDIKNHIIPFKFDTEQLTCCLCPNTFDRFKILQEHMHKHYRNYICDVCDTGFINQGSLYNHAMTHIKGNFACTSCPKVFDTLPKKNMHVRSCHSNRNALNRCGYCNEGFKEYYLKEEHLSKVHGVHTKVFNCNACDKSFSTQKRLKIHVKKDHLLERQHKCNLCEMNFFRLHDLKQHMVKHSGVKKFQCEICLKSYGRKTTLKEHMRIHNDDRRFKCEACGQAFVQKCSLKTHMKSRHRELVF